MFLGNTSNYQQIEDMKNEMLVNISTMITNEDLPKLELLLSNDLQMWYYTMEPKNSLTLLKHLFDYQGKKAYSRLSSALKKLHLNKSVQIIQKYEKEILAAETLLEVNKLSTNESSMDTGNKFAENSFSKLSSSTPPLLDLEDHLDPALHRVPDKFIYSYALLYWPGDIDAELYAKRIEEKLSIGIKQYALHYLPWIHGPRNKSLQQKDVQELLQVTNILFFIGKSDILINLLQIENPDASLSEIQKLVILNLDNNNTISKNYELSTKITCLQLSSEDEFEQIMENLINIIENSQGVNCSSLNSPQLELSNFWIDLKSLRNKAKTQLHCIGSNWEKLAGELGLTGADVDLVKSHSRPEQSSHVDQLIDFWQQKEANRAALGPLQLALLQCNQRRTYSLLVDVTHYAPPGCYLRERYCHSPIRNHCRNHLIRQDSNGSSSCSSNELRYRYSFDTDEDVFSNSSQFALPINNRTKYLTRSNSIEKPLTESGKLAYEIENVPENQTAANHRCIITILVLLVVLMIVTNCGFLYFHFFL